VGYFQITCSFIASGVFPSLPSSVPILIGFSFFFYVFFLSFFFWRFEQKRQKKKTDKNHCILMIIGVNYLWCRRFFITRIEWIYNICFFFSNCFAISWANIPETFFWDDWHILMNYNNWQPYFHPKRNIFVFVTTSFFVLFVCVFLCGEKNKQYCHF